MDSLRSEVLVGSKSCTGWDGKYVNRYLLWSKQSTWKWIVGRRLFLEMVPFHRACSTSGVCSTGFHGLLKASQGDLPRFGPSPQAPGDPKHSDECTRECPPSNWRCREVDDSGRWKLHLLGVFNYEVWCETTWVGCSFSRLHHFCSCAFLWVTMMPHWYRSFQRQEPIIAVLQAKVGRVFCLDQLGKMGRMIAKKVSCQAWPLSWKVWHHSLMMYTLEALERVMICYDHLFSDHMCSLDGTWHRFKRG